MFYKCDIIYIIMEKDALENKEFQKVGFGGSKSPKVAY